MKPSSSIIQQSLLLLSIALVFSLIPNQLFAQQKTPPRDTSFGIWTTYLKEKKYRPYIKIAEPDTTAGIVIKKDIVFWNNKGRELLLDIYYPKNTTTKHPAVLMIFGGGWRSGDKSHNTAMAIELAKRGYVAVSAEYRLSPEAQYPAAVNDLQDAIRWMRANAKMYSIDSSKIATLGCSAGGQLASLLGALNSPANAKVQAVVNIDGVLAFHHPESAEGAVAAQWLNGTYEENPENWEQASALTHANENTPPMLFINSSIPRFHSGRDDMIKKLSSFGIYTEVHTFEDSPHPFWFFNPWFQPTIEYTASFLQKVFK
jgi:pectinesterase